MAEESSPPEEETPPAEDVEQEETDDQEGESDADASGLRADLSKAVKRRDAALKRARDAEARLKALQSGQDGEAPAEDPVAKANLRVVRTEGRAVLAGFGVTSRDDQNAVLSVLSLADIEVTEDGDVDVEALEERLSSLRRILGGPEEKEQPPKKRTPRVDTRDRNGSTGGSADPDKSRWGRILTNGR